MAGDAVIVYTHANGIHTARLETKAVNPGPLLASALNSADGWTVTHRAGGAQHLMFVASEADAEQLLELVAKELAS
jgi:hypothetical protein